MTREAEVAGIVVAGADPAGFIAWFKPRADRCRVVDVPPPAA